MQIDRTEVPGTPLAVHPHVADEVPTALPASELARVTGGAIGGSPVAMTINTARVILMKQIHYHPDVVKQALKVLGLDAAPAQGMLH